MEMRRKQMITGCQKLSAIGASEGGLAEKGMETPVGPTCIVLPHEQVLMVEHMDGAMEHFRKEEPRRTLWWSKKGEREILGSEQLTSRDVANEVMRLANA